MKYPSTSPTTDATAEATTRRIASSTLAYSHRQLYILQTA